MNVIPFPKQMRAAMPTPPDVTLTGEAKAMADAMRDIERGARMMYCLARMNPANFNLTNMATLTCSQMDISAAMELISRHFKEYPPSS